MAGQYLLRWIARYVSRQDDTGLWFRRTGLLLSTDLEGSTHILHRVRNPNDPFCGTLSRSGLVADHAFFKKPTHPYPEGKPHNWHQPFDASHHDVFVCAWCIAFNRRWVHS